MSQIGDYTVLPLSLPPTSSFPTSATHTIYLRPHAPKIPTESDARSLFLVNVPVDSTPTHFKSVFSSLIGAGRVEDVRFEHEKRLSAPETQIVELGKKDKSKKRTRQSASWIQISRRSGTEI
jgi:ribosomal RNA-processing protein 7